MLFSIHVPAILPEFGSSLVVVDELLQLADRTRHADTVIPKATRLNLQIISIIL